MEDMMVEKAIRMEWRDWMEAHDKDGTRFVNEDMNLTMEYYKCKNAFVEGHKLGERCIDANEQD